MNYKLAKQLKKAGYPQYTIATGDAFYNENKEVKFEGERCKSNAGHSFHKDFHIRFPSLPELIEACGDKFGYLWLEKKEKNKRWFACDNDKWETIRAKTPEEAIAKLWLELNN